MPEMWERVALVALGGALGSVLRYAVAGVVNQQLGPSVLGTFVVNITGAAVLGLFLGLADGRFLIPSLARVTIAIGLLGGYTTFSTLAFETVDLAESGSWLTAALNSGGSLAAGLLAVYAGLVIGRTV